jgi:hypothetical protein
MSALVNPREPRREVELRRERYAEAIHGASGKSDDYSHEARAAMALADAEQATTLERMSADLRAVDSWADLDALRVRWGMKQRRCICSGDSTGEDIDIRPDCPAHETPAGLTGEAPF